MIGRSRCDFTFSSLESYVMTHGRGLWSLVNRSDKLGGFVNRVLINRAVSKAEARPHPFSTLGDYTSWESLTDTAWFGRHLPTKSWGDLPDPDLVATTLFRRPPGGGRLSPKSTMLFPTFAQWFTDGFLLTDADNARKTHTNQNLDFSPLYGLRVAETTALREPATPGGPRGRLKSQVIGGEEYPPYYTEDNGVRAKPEFAALRPPLTRLPVPLPPEQARTLFAVGGERVNTTPQTAMLNVLFLREHNRLAGLMSSAHPTWDDERVFQTARNVVTVMLIKVVVEEYINHISPYHFHFRADPAVAYKALWNRPSWITVEFNLLYRWHSLVPDEVTWPGGAGGGAGAVRRPMRGWLFDNRPLTAVGLAAAFDATSRQPATELGAFNTPDFLLSSEAASVRQGRLTGLASYNDYREAMKFPRVTSFDELTEDGPTREALRELYGAVDNVEFYAGLFAEAPRPNAAVPALIGRMVGIDAFSQALLNPLFAPRVFRPETFSELGWAEIARTSCLADLVARNVPVAPPEMLVTMSRAKLPAGADWPWPSRAP